MKYAAGGLALALWAVLPALAQEAPPTPVQAAQVIEAPLSRRITLSGSFHSPRASALSARVDGYILDIGVEAGDPVQTGQVLLQLDDEIPRLQLQRLQAELREAQTLLADQQRREREAADLLEQNNFSRSELESIRAERAAREARLEQVRADTAIQRTLVGRHRVTAPFDAVVTEKLVEVGQRVSGNAALLRIASMDPLWAQVQVPERHLPSVQTGNRVRIRPGFEHAGWIDSRVSGLVPVSTGGSRTFLVRSDVANPGWRLSPGMSLRMELALDTQAAGSALQVPSDAVVQLASGERQVWVAVPRGDALVAQPRKVSTGTRGDTHIEISGEGIGAGTLVITRGNETLRPGQAVSLAGERPGH